MTSTPSPSATSATPAPAADGVTLTPPHPRHGEEPRDHRVEPPEGSSAEVLWQTHRPPPSPSAARRHAGRGVSLSRNCRAAVVEIEDDQGGELGRRRRERP